PERSLLMKKLVVLTGLLAALALPAAASAHPLGNFTVNHFARVQVSGHTLYVRYVLDMAEIPTYQARQQGVDADAYALRLARGLRRSSGVRRTHSRPATGRPSSRPTSSASAELRGTRRCSG